MFYKSIKIDDFPSKLIANPYVEIINWSEKRFKLLGKFVFPYLSLMPISTYIPKIPYEGMNLPCNISFLLLTPSGGGKSLIAETMESICMNPYNVDKVSAPEMLSELDGQDNVSIITGDAGRIFRDKEFLKSLEMVIYDGRVRKRNKREILDYTINANCYLAGVPQDITSYLSSGILSRVTPMVIMHSREDQKLIGQGIIDSLGITNIKDSLTSEIIKNYYKFLMQIQAGENKEFPKIKGYILSEKTKDYINKVWSRNLDKSKTQPYENYYRELISGFKYMCASAFLNLPNRKVEDGFLVPNQEDLKVGLILQADEIATKINLTRMEKISSQIRDIKALEKVASHHNVGEMNYEILRVLVENKG